MVHFPNNPDVFDLIEAQQLTAEELVEKYENGKVKLMWDAKKRRNEALDCFVYALAALRISVSRWQLDLNALWEAQQSPTTLKTPSKDLAALAASLGG